MASSDSKTAALHRRLEKLTKEIAEAKEEIEKLEATITKLGPKSAIKDQKSFLKSVRDCATTIFVFIETLQESMQVQTEINLSNTTEEESKAGDEALQSLAVAQQKYRNYNELLTKKANEFSRSPDHSLQKQAKTILQELSKRKGTDEIIKHRSYTPQQFAAIVSMQELSSPENYKYLSTSGISPCVGCVIYSKASQICLLTHFDDRVGVTNDIARILGKEPKNNSQEQIMQHIERHSEGKKQIEMHIQYIAAMLEQLGKPIDTTFVLIPSSMLESKVLKCIIQNAIQHNGVAADNIIEQGGNNPTESVLLELANYAISSYEETTDLNTQNAKPIQVALNLPTTGLRLFYMENGVLIPQNIQREFQFQKNYMLPPSKDVGHQAINETSYYPSKSMSSSSSMPSGISSASSADQAVNSDVNMQDFVGAPGPSPSFLSPSTKRKEHVISSSSSAAEQLNSPLASRADALAAAWSSSSASLPTMSSSNAEASPEIPLFSTHLAHQDNFSLVETSPKRVKVEDNTSENKSSKPKSE